MAAETQGWSTVVLPPSSIVSMSLGSLLIGVMAAHLLLGIVCSHATTYFRHHFYRDGRFLRLIVISLVTLNLLLGIMDFVSVYQATVHNFGDFNKFDLQPRGWYTWAEPAVTALVALIAHTFYICRCWTLMRSFPVTVFLVLIALLAFAFGIATSVFALIIGRLSEMGGEVVHGTIWLLSTCICDISITIILAIYFWRNSSTSAAHRTNAIFSRLRRISIETGSLTAICALINLVLFTAFAPKAYYLWVQYSMSHIYTVAVLYTLLSRQDLRDIIHTGIRTDATGIRQSPLFTSVLNFPIHNKTTIPTYSQNVQAQDLGCCYDNLTGDANAIVMHCIHNHDNSSDLPYNVERPKDTSLSFNLNDGMKNGERRCSSPRRWLPSTMSG